MGTIVSQATESRSDEKPPVDVENSPRRVAAFQTGLLVSVTVAFAVVLASIDVQSARILDQNGRAWALHTLFGADFGSGLNREGWLVLTSGGFNQEADLYRRLALEHLAVDTLFIVCYAVLLAAVVFRLRRSTVGALVGFVLVLGLASVDLGENVTAMLLLFTSGSAVGSVLMAAVLLLTAVKWMLALLLALLIIARLVMGPGAAAEGPGGLRRAGKAIMHQRFSYFPVAVLFVLAVLSGSAILEQLPDVERGWIDSPTVGLLHAVTATLSIVGLAYFLSVIGRFRTQHAIKNEKGRNVPSVDDKPELKVWLVAPLLSCIGALIAFDARQTILIERLIVFAVVVPALVIGGSLLIRWAGTKSALWLVKDDPITFTPREQFAISVAGTVAAASAVVVGGLSLLRAFSPLVILPRPETSPGWGWIGLFLILGFVAVMAPWLVLIKIAPRDDRLPIPERPGWLRSRRPVNLGSGGNESADSPSKSWLQKQGAWILLFAAIAAFLLLALSPGLSAFLGLTATAILSIGSFTGILSAFALLVQDKPTAEIFRILRLRRTPLISMLVLTVALIGLSAGGRGLHDVARGYSVAPTSDARPTMAGSFQTWLNSPTVCEIDLGVAKVRPMLLLAAEGGGIRAAYWTVQGLQAIEDQTCGEHSALFAAGASGGSVGLTVARFSGRDGQPDGAAAIKAVEGMADPGILAKAANGTFVRDILAGANGVPIPRLGETDPWTWWDRAAFIEDGWNHSGEWGRQPFLSPGTALSPATGQLILNSTTVKDTCRVWVSQIDLGSTGTADDNAGYDEELSCDTGPVPAPRTIDLFKRYGPFVPLSTEGCLGMISASTAALLTARFPYVTPSGAVGPCPDPTAVSGDVSASYWPRTQLVDGGYIENTGLATITDLADDWLPLVREHNRAALRIDPSAPEPLTRDTTSAGTATKPVLIVPMIVFFNNGDRRVVQPARDASPTSEVTVPIATLLRGGSALSNNDAMLERARSTVELGGFCPTSTSVDACDAIRLNFPSRVIVVDRLTQPEIGAPLGWALSAASTSALKEAMSKQRTTTCNANTPQEFEIPAPSAFSQERQPSCRAGYGTLGDLVRYYNAVRKTR